MNINKTKISIILFFYFLQASPVLVWQVIPKQSNWEQAYRLEKENECFENYLTHQIEIYKETERKNPGMVFGGVEGVTKNYTPLYRKMCNEIVIMRYFSASYFLLFVLSFFLLIPASWVSAKLLQSATKTPKHRLLSCIKVLIAILCAMIGAVIVWGACLPEIYVPRIINALYLVVGLPVLISVIVFVEAFGRAFAYSGIHAPQNVLQELEKDSKL